MIRIDFDVLVLNLLFFECNPDALDEGTEPAAVKFKRVVSRVSL